MAEPVCDEKVESSLVFIAFRNLKYDTFESFWLRRKLCALFRGQFQSSIFKSDGTNVNLVAYVSSARLVKMDRGDASIYQQFKMNKESL